MLTATRSHGEARAIGLVGPRSALVRELTAAYWQEIETVSNYVTSSTNRGGIRAERIARSFRETLASHLEHAQEVAISVGQLHVAPPGPDDFATRQPDLRPPAEPHDNLSVLTGLIDAETTAVERYRRIAALASEAYDSVTQGLANRIMREKGVHRQSLSSLLRAEKQS